MGLKVVDQKQQANMGELIQRKLNIQLRLCSQIFNSLTGKLLNRLLQG